MSIAVTHCPRGHAYDEANTYVTPKGFRDCRECRREASRRHKAGVTIALSTEERFWAKVTKTETCWLWTSALNDKGYGQFFLGGRTQHAHRVAYTLLRGPIPAGLFLDHKCHVEACVNPSHLRPATNKQNSENRKGPNKGSTSGVLGVHWHSGHGKWAAVVSHNGKRLHLGYFPQISEAAAVAAAKRNELFTHNTMDGATR